MIDLKKQKDYYKIDFTNKIQIKNTLYKFTKKYKNINALFNLAASQVFTSFEKRTHEEIDEIMDVNIKSNILMTQFVFNKYFKKNKQGKIINISSIFGFSSPDFKNYGINDRKSSEIYGASKAAIIQLTKYFAKYMSNYNINVNCVSPGGIKTLKLKIKNLLTDIQKKYL